MIKKDVKISEVLHLAADKYLESGLGPPNLISVNFSCSAIRKALHELKATSRLEYPIFQGLTNMGVDIRSAVEFHRLGRHGRYYLGRFERQAARYNWLKFAAMIAEEQGV
jgi:hypothetical protein